MHANRFIHDLLTNVIHKSRIKLLNRAVNAIIMTKELSLTKLGRRLDSAILERSSIRKMDRLLANRFFQEHSLDVYECITRCAIGSQQRPWIVVDWSKLPNTNHYTLRAALAAESRSITLYEEVHPKKKEGNTKVQTAFLKQLKYIVPSTACPIIVTDAGFKNPWFKKVLHNGWDYVGRLRGPTGCSQDGGITFEKINTLFERAKTTPHYLGQGIIAKGNPLTMSLYTLRKKLKGRKKYTKTGKLSVHKDSKNHSKSCREPWLLVSSLSGKRMAKKVVKIYEKRMSIEESFRDMKSQRYGFNMEHNKTLKEQRLIVWLMLAALASLLAWVVGYVGESMGLHHQFQANTIRKRRVLSFFYLGCQIIRKNLNIHFSIKDIELIASGMQV